MKLFFLKDDSLYKIYKTLEKVSSKKPLVVYIDEDNDFFAHQRRGKQIKELIEHRNLSIHFVSKNRKTQAYYEQIGLPVLVQHTTKRIKAAHALYQLIFNIKQFHRGGSQHHQYMGYIILLLEGGLIVGALYLMSMLILPGATVRITPSMNTEDIIYNVRFSRTSNTGYSSSSLTVPIKTGSLQYEYSLALSVRNAQYLQKPAQGVITFTNKSSVPYSLIKGTQLISEDGVIFRTNHWVSIPAKQGEIPGVAYAEVSAAEFDVQGNLIGPRGNIPANTPLLVRNLRNSFLLKQVTATNTKAFVGGSSSSMGEITQRDIDALSGKLASSIRQQAPDIIKSNIILKDGILLPIKEPSIQIVSINISGKIGSKQPIISGTIISSIEYEYALWDDIEQMYRTYIAQRPSSRNKLITIQKNTLTFFDAMNQQQTGQIIIPSKITLVWGYDLVKDTNALIPDIKNRIAGLGLDEAKDVILSYPEIATASISISPPRYTTIPLTKSRIIIK